MQTVGSQLREVRESLGILLEDAADVTRIGKNYLSAIEGDMFDKLPSSAYVKGFLRVYAGFLGLSGDEVIAMYDSQTKQTPPQSPVIVDGGRQPERKTEIPRFLRWLPPILVLVITASLFYYITHNEDKIQKVTTVGDLGQSAPAPVLPAYSSAVMKGTTGRELSGAREGEPVAKGAAPPQEGIILKMKVNQDCWLNITIDDSISQQYDLKAGDLIEWKGKRVFALDMGNAGGVEAELNGTPLAPFGGEGMTAHVVLKGDGG